MHPPTAPWRTPTHLRTLRAQIASTPPSPLPSLIHLTLRAILPFLLFTTFVIAGTIVLIYTLSLSKPVPARFVIGATVAFVVLGFLAGGVWVGVRVARAQGRAVDVEARLTGGSREVEGAAPVWRPLAACIPELGPEGGGCFGRLGSGGVESADFVIGGGRAHVQGRPQRDVRDSHELQAPPQRKAVPPNGLRDDTPAPGSFLREATPWRDRYPRHVSAPLSLSSARTSVHQAYPNAPATAWHQQDSAYQVCAAKESSWRGSLCNRASMGGGTSVPEGVLGLGLPNKLRKARGLGMGGGKRKGKGKGGRRSVEREEVVLESVEGGWPLDVEAGLGKAKGVEIGFGKDVKLAQVEGNVQRLMLLLHEHGKGERV